MYAAISRLDHLQDGDSVEHELPTINHQDAQYNLIFGYYLFATTFLDTFPLHSIPLHRILRLRHLWSHLVLRMASGQQRDIITRHNTHIEVSLEYYQETAQAKTGASFALAFGGAAILYTDDEAIIDAFILVGELYGTILQYSDDIKDESEQLNLNITLPKVLDLRKMVDKGQERTVLDFLMHIHRIYREVVVRELNSVPSHIRENTIHLFDQLFASK
jgi:hypothetical protein